MVRILRKISRSFFGSPEAGINMPRMDARTRIERLAPPPFAEAGERLAVVRLALLVRLGREAGDGKLGFDESGHERTL